MRSMSLNMRLRYCFILVLSTASLSLAQDAEPGAGANATEDQVPIVSDEQPMSFWMTKKLEYSKDMLQALTSSDFETLEIRLEQMRLLAGIEGFMRGRNPVYTAHLRTFNMATYELKQQSKAKNIEAATAAFNKMTTSCVACHQTLRQSASGSEGVTK